ncbi:HNH endonuclease [Paucisalibacillus globulus]|uniref:HNH endonuclease n=1 Tax=Paucisalibacillus globulus TaxID=351095 RepID=UPI000BB92B36|nr:HNH endonuclease [Paucisalibacillus globulus]
MVEYKTAKQKKTFYNSGSWKSLRKQALERDNYECQVCKRAGSYNHGQNVHHIKEIEFFPKLALELDNLETLCINCHNQEHGRTFDKLRQNPNKKQWNDEKW